MYVLNKIYLKLLPVPVSIFRYYQLNNYLEHKNNKNNDNVAIIMFGHRTRTGYIYGYKMNKKQKK